LAELLTAQVMVPAPILVVMSMALASPLGLTPP
jgi:hypothetical protein